MAKQEQVAAVVTRSVSLKGLLEAEQAGWRGSHAHWQERKALLAVGWRQAAAGSGWEGGTALAWPHSGTAALRTARTGG